MVYYQRRVGSSTLGKRPGWSDAYLVTVEELEQRTGETFPEVLAYARSEKPAASWLVPIGCEKG